MVSVAIVQAINTVAAARIREARAANKHPKMVWRGSLGTSVVFPYAPLDDELSGFGPAWNTLGRGRGRLPFLVAGDRQLKTYTFDLTIAYVNDRDISVILNALRALADREQRVTIGYGTFPVGGTWKITNLSVRVTRRQKNTNAPTAATASVTLTLAPPDPKKVGPKPAGKPKPGGKIVKAKKGDTVWRLSKRHYGTTAYWKTIAKANNITKAHKKLKAGTSIRIPKKPAGAVGTAVSLTRT